LIGRLGVQPSHPTTEQLLTWHEGEMDEPVRQWVSDHVRSCERCRAEAVAAREVIARASSALIAPRLLAGGAPDVERLRAALRNRRLLATVRRHVRGESDARLAETLRPFFGSYPSARLAGGEAGRGEFQNQAIMLAQTLLGRKAAEALIESHVRDAAEE